MAASVRTNKKAIKIYHNVLGKPAFANMRKTQEDKRIDNILNQRLINTNPIYTQ